MSYPIVLAIDSESCSAALAALEIASEQLGPGKTYDRMTAALQDFQRAIATFHLIDSQITIPALLRRQV